MTINVSLGVFLVHCIAADLPWQLPVKLQIPTLVMLTKFSLVSLSVGGRKVMTAYLAHYSSTCV